MPDNKDDGLQGLGVLLSGGDWACALGDADVLADVARALIPEVDTNIQLQLSEIIKLTQRDFPAACDRWAKLSGHLRAQLMIAAQQFGKYQA